MKKICFLLVFILVFSLFGCNSPSDSSSGDTVKRYYDTRIMTDFEYTSANLCALDKTGRYAPSGDVYNGKETGIFYHLWHGVHETPGKVLNLTDIMRKNPDYLTYEYIEENKHRFHYWDEPLYGYYCSADPWVLTRHIELMTLMGVDFFVYDYTNSTRYDEEADTMFELLDKYYKQGFKVPKVTMYTNSASASIVIGVYNRYFADGAVLKGKYDHLWYSPNEKPLIIGVTNQSPPVGQEELYSYLTTEFFDFRESQWPDGKTTVLDREKGFPWMEWVYPQNNYNGYMSVSVSQHPGAQASAGARMNFGRGYYGGINVTEDVEIGTNYQSQWDTAIADSSVNTVMITGFNEWMAIKHNDGEKSIFVDLFSEEYSRDVEMMKGGYDDNYVIQTLLNTRKFKYSEAKHYKYSLNSIDIEDSTLSGFNKVLNSYRDFSGDAMPRNYRDAFRTTTYIDNSNRNDIEKVTVTHDENNLYVLVNTKDDVTAYDGGENWMTLLIGTGKDNENSFGGFNFIINRSPEANGKTSVEKSRGGYNWALSGKAEYRIYGNAMVYSVPLSMLGLDKDNCELRLKVSDNVTHFDEIMDYYVSGDSAPLGRFAYSYGF